MRIKKERLQKRANKKGTPRCRMMHKREKNNKFRLKGGPVSFVSTKREPEREKGLRRGKGKISTDRGAALSDSEGGDMVAIASQRLLQRRVRRERRRRCTMSGRILWSSRRSKRSQREEGNGWARHTSAASGGQHEGTRGW